MQYSYHGDYDAPPPTSYFRRQGRPWSPHPQEQQQQHELPSFNRQADQWSGAHSGRRREPSESSVEALDLADYSRIAQARSPHYAPFRQEYPEYPPSPPPARPFSAASRDTPSLVSSPDTLSSQSYHTHVRSNQSHRPFSLPPPTSWNSHRTPHSAPNEPRIRRSLDSIQERASAVGGAVDEIDIAHFPAWSRHWYAAAPGTKDKKTSRTSLPRQTTTPDHASFFDPTYRGTGPRASSSPRGAADIYGDPYFGSSMGSSSRGNGELLPWSARDQFEADYPLDDETKEERLRMLEREFGPNAPGSQPPPERVVGSVDGKGNLITQGPRKRIAARALEISLALVAAASAIYAVLAIKPPSAPPPEGKASTYALYVLSIISFLVAFWLFAIRPCCCGRRKAAAAAGLTGDGPAGLAVLPIQGLPGGGKPAKGKRGKKGQQEQGAVQVNLIVDPSAFMPGGMREGDDGEGMMDDGEGSGMGFSAASGGGGGVRRQPKRRSVFQGLAMERAWKVARKELKWMLVFDILSLVLWAVEFVWILLGDKCPPGGFNGWCNAFNVATASACLLVLLYGFSIFFDVKDLHQSSTSPRTRP